MEKYRRKQYYVDAVEYKEGMEDGMGCPHNQQGTCVNLWETNNFCRHCKSNGYAFKKPYINTLKGKQFLFNSDYIVTENGERGVISKEELEKDYDFICK